VGSVWAACGSDEEQLAGGLCLLAHPLRTLGFISEKRLNLAFYTCMNLKDIEIGKYYSYFIWADDHPIYFECIGKEDGYFEMREYDPDYICFLENLDQEDPNLQEISKMQYVIRYMGMITEATILLDIDEKLC
jgi:hypothetical protein